MGRRRGGLLLAVAATLVALAPGAPGVGPAGGQAAGPSPRAGRAGPPEAAVIVDANGNEVGPVIAFAGVPAVRLRGDGRDAVLQVLGHRLVPVAAPALYESADCSGRPWILDLVPPGAAALIADLATVGRLNELLVTNGDPETRSIGSRWNPFSPVPVCDVDPSPDSEIVRPTRVLMDLNVFEPPFRLR